VFSRECAESALHSYCSDHHGGGVRILVTGGTGFTGKALVKRLIDDGHQVVALDYKEGLKTGELRSMGAEVVIGSVTDRDVVRRSLRGVEVVQHLAAAFRELNVPEQYYWDVNVGGTRICLEEAKAAGVRKFIYCSTCGVHGDVKNPPTDEAHNIAPADYYQQTKYEAEPIVAEFFAGGLPTVILRPAAIYGPGDPERFFGGWRRGPSRCSAAARLSTTRSTSTTSWTRTSWRWRRAGATGRST
jgi:nucleoside-diphosphate-sugar epimerase